MKTIYICGGVTDCQANNLLEAAYIKKEANALGTLLASLGDEVSVYFNSGCFSGLIGEVFYCIACENVNIIACDGTKESAAMRKQAEGGDLFIALPGGLDTIAELTKALQREQQVAIIDPSNFYAGLVYQFDEAVNNGFIEGTNFNFYSRVKDFARNFNFNGQAYATPATAKESRHLIEKMRAFTCGENEG